MADRGATFVHTSIWPVTMPGTTNFGETRRATFPVTDQEAANLRAFAQDVAAVQGVGGNRLSLDIALLWLGASDYTIGSPTTALGYTPIPAAEFISYIETTTDKVLAAVADVIRPDGVRVVDTIFFDAELACSLDERRRDRDAIHKVTVAFFVCSRAVGRDPRSFMEWTDTICAVPLSLGIWRVFPVRGHGSNG